MISLEDPDKPAVTSTPTRRTVLAGAAWTIPTIAAATVSPLAAATNVLSLQFNKTSYSGTACDTITGAYVTATLNNASAAGKSITVSLSNGYTFSAGAASATGTTGADGRFNLPAISVPAAGGTATATATSTGATTALASMSAPASSAAGWRSLEGTVFTYGAQPNTATALTAWSSFLNGTTVYKGKNAAITKVTAVEAFDSLTTAGVEYVGATCITDGVAYSWADTGRTPTTFPAVPGTATPLRAWSTFRDGTDVWFENATILTGVTSAGALQMRTSSGTEYTAINYVQGGTAYSWDSSTQTSVAYPAVPSTAVATNAWAVFVDGGDVWFDNTKVIAGASNVRAFRARGDDQTEYSAVNVIKGGVAYSWSSLTGSLTTFSSIPGTATPLDAWGSFINGTDVWVGNTKILTNVDSAAGFNGVTGAGTAYVSITFVRGGTGYAWSNAYGQSFTYPNTPASATPLAAWRTYLDGTDVWFNDQKILTGVTSARGFAYRNGAGMETQNVTFMQGGKAYSWNNVDNTSVMYGAVPSTATPLPALSVFVDGTDVWFNNSKIVTGVDSAAAFSAQTTAGVQYTAVIYTKSGGAYAWSSASGSSVSYTSVPSNAQPLAAWAIFYDGTAVWKGNTKILDGVSAAQAYQWWEGDGTEYTAVTYMKGGKAYTWTSDGGFSLQYPAVPSTAQPLRGWSLFIDNGTLWFRNSAAISGIGHAEGFASTTTTGTEYFAVNFTSGKC